jgi:hypothetical protein
MAEPPRSPEGPGTEESLDASIDASLDVIMTEAQGEDGPVEVKADVLKALDALAETGEKDPMVGRVEEAAKAEAVPPPLPKEEPGETIEARAPADPPPIPAAEPPPVPAAEPPPVPAAEPPPVAASEPTASADGMAAAAVAAPVSDEAPPAAEPPAPRDPTGELIIAEDSGVAIVEAAQIESAASDEAGRTCPPRPMRSCSRGSCSRPRVHWRRPPRRRARRRGRRR